MKKTFAILGILLMIPIVMAAPMEAEQAPVEGCGGTVTPQEPIVEESTNTPRSKHRSCDLDRRNYCYLTMVKGYQQQFILNKEEYKVEYLGNSIFLGYPVFKVYKDNKLLLYKMIGWNGMLDIGKEKIGYSLTEKNKNTLRLKLNKEGYN